MNNIILGSIFMLAITGSSTSIAEAQKVEKPSTFTEQTEPSISIKPLTREQQEAKEKESLTTSIQKIILSPVIPPIELVKGKRVDDQFRAIGKRAGWNLIWQAPEYVLDQNMMIPGDFESSVLFFLNGANEAGARLRAVFYRGNKTVRVTEF